MNYQIIIQLYMIHFLAGYAKFPVNAKNVKNKMKMAYTIVPEQEANLKLGKISVNTPIAQGLIGKKVGDVVEIRIPKGTITLEVLDISF